MRMKSQLSLIISFQVETSLTIVLFLLLSPLIMASQRYVQNKGWKSRRWHFPLTRWTAGRVSWRKWWFCFPFFLGRNKALKKKNTGYFSELHKRNSPVLDGKRRAWFLSRLDPSRSLQLTNSEAPNNDKDVSLVCFYSQDCDWELSWRCRVLSGR